MKSNKSNLQCALCGRILTNTVYTNTQGSNKTLWIPYSPATPGTTTSGTINVNALCCPSGHKYYLAEVDRQNFNCNITYSDEFLEQITHGEGKVKATRIIDALRQNIVSIYTVNYGLMERIRELALDNIRMIIVARYDGVFYNFYLAIKRNGRAVHNWEHIIVDYKNSGNYD